MILWYIFTKFIFFFLNLEKKKKIIKDFGNLNNFIDEKIGIKELITSHCIPYTYSKILFKRVDCLQFIGISS